MENNFIEMEWSRLWWLLSVVVTEYVLVLAAVGADMASGISKSRKRGEATRSRSLRRTVDKLARYYNVLVVLTVVDAMQIAGAWFMRAVEGYAVPTVPLFTLLGSLGMAGIEVKSIFEKGSDKEHTDVGALLDLLESAADNEKLTKKVTVDEGVEAVEFVEFILHGIDSFRINAQEDGSFVGTSTKSISNRDASQIFHLNFVLKNGVGNSELYRDGMSFKPSEGSTSAVAEVETEAAKVVAANGVIRVEGDKTFAVYTVAGQLAFRGMGEVRLDKGVYVVVVDGKAQKVML